MSGKPPNTPVTTEKGVFSWSDIPPGLQTKKKKKGVILVTWMVSVT